MSLKGKPITIGHKGVVNSQNIDALHPVGTVLSEGRKDNNNIVADVILYTLPTEDRELSCGYTLDLDETSGVTPDGEHYDAVQRNIRYNHLAIVHRGRAGVSRLNMDGDQVIENFQTDGGDGSGNFGYAGRVGEIGGSASSFEGIVNAYTPDENGEVDTSKLTKEINNAAEGTLIQLEYEYGDADKFIKLSNGKYRKINDEIEDLEYSASDIADYMEETDYEGKISVREAKINKEKYERDLDNYNQYMESNDEFWDYAEKKGSNEFKNPPKSKNEDYDGFKKETSEFPYKKSIKSGEAYIAEMSPDEYLDRCKFQIYKNGTDDSLYRNVDKNLAKKYAHQMKDGVKFEMPYLDYEDVSQEGRHRAIAAKEAGIKKMPVLIIGDSTSIKHNTQRYTRPDKYSQNYVIEDSNKEDEMVKIRIDSGLEYETAPEVKVYAERLAQENQDLKSEMAAKDKHADEDLKTIKAEMAEKQKATDEEISSLKAEIEKLKAGKKEKEAEADEAKKDCEAAKAELEKAKQDSSILQAKCDSAEADVQKLKEEAEKKDEEFKANFDSAVKERIEMLSIAKAHNIEKADEMNAHDIKVAVIKSVRGDSFDLEGKDDNYINVCYDLCKDDETKKHNDGMSAQRQQFGKQNDRKDSDELSVEELEKRLRKDESELYLKEVK